MAPEVFMRTMAEGHGRAADIWSVGCVIIEMSTGIVKSLFSYVSSCCICQEIVSKIQVQIVW